MAPEIDGDPCIHPLQGLPTSLDLSNDASAVVALLMLGHQNSHSKAAVPSPTYSDAGIDAKLIYVDQEIQVGALGWGSDVFTPDHRFDHILIQLKRGGWSIGRFLAKLFTIPNQGGLSRSRRHAEAVSTFLGGSGGHGARYETVKPDKIVELMYSSRNSAPKATCKKAGKDRPKEARDASGMARHLLSKWAIQKVEGYISTALMQISGKDGGFHINKEQTTWEFILGFLLAKAVVPIELNGAVLLHILAAAALPAVLRENL
jgi:hypothetical protein